jgi:hypothetical protein
MRSWLLALLVLAAALPAAADERRPRADVEVVIPVVPFEHERLHYFGKHDHHVVPGTVTINGARYICDLDGTRYTDRDRFVAHLRSAHGAPAEAIPDRLVVVDGRVHFVGDGPAALPPGR